ncbi:RNA polymerase-associated protein RapA [Jeotgalibaca dankookensis]|uniref:RNA polymerase-associated protein RapA n=1 Tax=Jeotgalibaca dankookensis TaxID=708126 RepID=A0A1S6IQE1_9LACT|nr:SNF2 helicase associated domain-containing protein [Jeotgalibaca dankookensis]AQS53739.1 RNA polymerase-associated protein RapA [Jeotgalibaca dankookensis]
MEWRKVPVLTLSEENLPNDIFNKGVALYGTNKVNQQTVEEKPSRVKITFSVASNPLVMTEVNVDAIRENLSGTCTCSYFKNNEGPCEHLIASMLKYNDLADQHNAQESENKAEIEVEPETDNYLAATYIMNNMTDFLDADTGYRGRKKVKFEYQFAIQSLDEDEESSIRVRVGTNKLYQIKNVEQAAELFLRETPQWFGKDFEYDPAEHYIGSKDRNMLYTLLELKNYHFQSKSYYNYSAGNKTEITVPPVMIKETLKKVLDTENHSVKIHHQDKAFEEIIDPIIFEEGETLLPLSFEISEVAGREDLYEFRQEEKEAMPFHLFPIQKVMVQENTLYFLLDEELRIINILINATHGNKKDRVVIPKNMMRDFMTSSVPTIRKRFSLTVSPKVKKEFQKEKLKAKLYLDWQEERLWVDLQFFYGEESYRPLVFNETDGLPETVLVDLEAEGAILNVFYDFEFPFDIVEDKLSLYDPDEIYRFIYDALPEFGEMMEIYTTENMNHLLYTAQASPQLVIDMNEKSNLLQVTFDIEGIDEAELKKIMKDLAANKKYRRLSNGKLINLKDQAFQQYQETLQQLDINPTKASREMEMPLHRIFALDDATLQRANLKNPVKEFLKRLDSLETINYPRPSALVANLRPYQEEGFQWLKMLDAYGFGGVLADDMGLGKTVQALTYIASSIEENDQPILVVCPSSVLYNWQKEARQFLPNLETALITGPKEERDLKIAQAKADGIKLWITSYPVLLRDIDLYGEIIFRSIILDEAQIVKNNIAKTTKAVRQLKAHTKFALSGTPLENQLGELFSIFSIVVPGLFPSQKAFKNMDIAQINRKIKPFVLRRLKKDVLTELPDKVESVEYIDLADQQKAMYLSQLRLVRSETNELLEAGTVNENRIKILAGLTRLRQICCDPRLVNPDYQGESAKLERLMEYLDNARENGKRVVLFSQFTQMLQIIRNRLAEQERDYFYLDGQTPNLERLALTTRFNEGEKDLFLISLRAGGTGLNLTGGDTVILYDSWWNPAVESQATDRVHRYGQTKKVQVIRMICTGTIEERINELQDKKRELIDQVITEGKQSFTSLSKEEIIGILGDE